MKLARYLNVSRWKKSGILNTKIRHTHEVEVSKCHIVELSGRCGNERFSLIRTSRPTPHPSPPIARNRVAAGESILGACRTRPHYPTAEEAYR
jgi:hypothetical protein